MTQPTDKPKTVKLVENDTKLAAKQNKTFPPQPQLTRPSAKSQLTTANTPLTKPRKINRSSKNKTIRKTKEKKRKKDNKTQKPSKRKKEVTTSAYFPYFTDNYCPPECACYGRVVQCSDKGMDKVPYGIPYNARYVLLMNNHINSIQLDLLNEYVSMEFLVLSNNLLTDGAIEGAFEGVPALKRLYLDRNLLESVPTDLPFSLEELRLDNNQLGVMSEALEHNLIDMGKLDAQKIILKVLEISRKKQKIKSNLANFFVIITRMGSGVWVVAAVPPTGRSPGL
uniref:Wu:fc23c09 n=1 Tax=Lates calcarifer TaxID=8187 RepID=A0A4W6E7H6_LATCA